MGLGCYPGSDPQFLGMLGMHGTYEANLAMHGCDVHAGDRRAVRRPGDRAAERVQPGIAEDPYRHRSVLDQQERAGRRRHRRRRRQGAGRAAGRVEGTIRRRPTRRRWPRGGARSTNGASKDMPELHAGHDAGRDHQAAIRDPAAVRDHPRGEAGHLHHHRGRPAPDVGRAALPVRTAEPLDDLAAGSAPWAMACRPRWACRSRIPTRW